MRSNRRERALGRRGEDAETEVSSAWRVIAAAFAAALVLSIATPAHAHTVGLSRGEYALSGGKLTVALKLARGELATAIAGLDTNRDGTVDEAEVAAGGDALRAGLVDHLVVHDGDRACPATLDHAALAAEDGVEIDAHFDCGSAARHVDVDAGFLAVLPSGHRHVAHIGVGESARDEVLYKNKERFGVDAIGAAASAPVSSWRDVAWGFFLQGIEHILTGYDHLAFLLGLVLVRGRLKSVLALVTAFTLAHSVTLAIAVLGVWAPSPRFTEPAIALSVAYVGGENFFVKDLKNRWHITAPFGLIHGFGFAGALGQIALPRAQVPLALGTFNLGVEAGQLGVLAIVLPLVHLARKLPAFDRWGVKVLSGALLLLGLVWFVGRVVWPPG